MSQTAALDRSGMIGSHTEFAQRRLQNIGFRCSECNNALWRKFRQACRKWQTGRRADFKIDDRDKRIRVIPASGGETQQSLSGPAGPDSNAGLHELPLQRRSPARTILKNNDLSFGHQELGRPCRSCRVGLASLGPPYSVLSSSKFIPRRT